MVNSQAVPQDILGRHSKIVSVINSHYRVGMETYSFVVA